VFQKILFSDIVADTGYDPVRHPNRTKVKEAFQAPVMDWDWRR
jgi:hypothetical protein